MRIRAFNRWALDGQNKIDIHLMLKRLVHIIHDGFLRRRQARSYSLSWILALWNMQCLFTDIQKAIRKYHNPKFTKLHLIVLARCFACCKGSCL
jgi:hypothetical protein